MLCSGAKGFIGIQAPHLILNKPTVVTPATASAPFTSNVGKHLMQGFAGMQVSADIHWGADAKRRPSLLLYHCLIEAQTKAKTGVCTVNPLLY